MRAIELNLESVLYRVQDGDKIECHAVKSIMRRHIDPVKGDDGKPIGGGDGLQIVIHQYDRKLLALLNDCTAIDEYKSKYYFSLDDAQKAQLRLRKTRIQKRFEELQKVLSEYNELIDKWFDKPAHNPYENKD